MPLVARVYNLVRGQTGHPYITYAKSHIFIPAPPIATRTYLSTSPRMQNLQNSTIPFPKCVRNVWMAPTKYQCTTSY